MNWVNWETNNLPSETCRCGASLIPREIVTKEKRDGVWHDEPVRVLSCSKAKSPYSTAHSYAMCYRWAAEISKQSERTNP